MVQYSAASSTTSITSRSSHEMSIASNSVCIVSVVLPLHCKLWAVHECNKTTSS